MRCGSHSFDGFFIGFLSKVLDLHDHEYGSRLMTQQAEMWQSFIWWNQSIGWWGLYYDYGDDNYNDHDDNNDDNYDDNNASPIDLAWPDAGPKQSSFDGTNQ